MNDNNYDNNGNKLVHVKAYNRSDGTYVKEHWRGQGESFASKQKEYDWPPKEEKYELPEEGCFPNGDDVIYTDGNGVVLQGGIEKTDLPSGTGGGLGEILAEILGALPLIMQIIAGITGSGATNISQIKGSFDDNVSRVKQYQKTYKTNLDNLLQNVVFAPTQKEYSKQTINYQFNDI